MQGLQDGVAIVTGGGSGMGRATALRFGAAGTKVVVADISAEGAEETVRQIEAAGGAATACVMDLRHEDGNRQMVEAALSHYGRLDFAVNCAGVSQQPMRLENLPLEDFQRDYSVNAQGVFLSMKYQLPAMVRNGGGAIVNVSSGAGMSGFAFYSGYAASKHACIGLTLSAALEYADRNVRVNCVAPGAIASPMLTDNPSEITKEMLGFIPAKRFGAPEEVASACVWLCSDESSYTSGQVMAVNGAWGSSALGLVTAFPIEDEAAPTREGDD